MVFQLWREFVHVKHISSFLLYLGSSLGQKRFFVNKIELSFFECYRCVLRVSWMMILLSTEQTEIDKL